MRIVRLVVPVLILVLVSIALSPSAAFAAPPANDNLAAAQTIARNSTTLGTNSEATLEVGEPAPSCQATTGATVWFKYTATATETLTADTQGSSFDTVLDVFSGPAVSPTFPALTPLACSDDIGGGPLQSRLSFAATSGITYYIRVGGFSAATGSIILPLGVVPPNDNRSDAIAIVQDLTFAPYDVNIDNTVATLEPDELPGSGCLYGYGSVWYTLNLTGSPPIEIDTYGSGVDTIVRMNVFFLLWLGAGCSDDTPAGSEGALSFKPTDGVTYYIRVASKPNGGPIHLHIEVDNDIDAVGQSKDNCRTVANGPNETTVLGAGFQADNDGDAIPGAVLPPGSAIGGDACDVDDDNDGIPDTSDIACRTRAEDLDGFEDSDGCPDPDNDGDGICDAGQVALTCTGSDIGKLCFDPAGTLSCATQDCRSLAEDYDAFKDSDGCPEPDNDNDGFPDFTDQCPGTGSQAGADGMLGSHQDLNHNGVQDGGEATLTTDDVMPLLAWEDKDGVLDTDGCHDSPGGDLDGDGFTDDAEALTIGTNAGYPCGYNSWPADLWDQPPLSANKITVQDLTSFIAPVRRLNTSAPNPNFSTRWDLVPGNGTFSSTINVQDMTALVTLTPPILNGARALNGPACPMPSQ